MTPEDAVEKAVKDMLNPVKHATDRADRARALAKAENISLGEAIARVLAKEKENK